MDAVHAEGGESMIRIAIVEDDSADLSQELEFLKRFGEESGEQFLLLHNAGDNPQFTTVAVL